VAAINQSFAANARLPVRDQVYATVEGGTLSVLVTASEENHKKVAELIQEVDQPDSSRQTFSIDLAHADPEDVVTALRGIYSTRQITRRGQLPASFTMVPGARKIMVSSTSSEFEEIKQLVTELDAEEAATGRDTRVIAVRNITPAEMTTIL